MKIRQRLSRLEEAIKPPHPINPYRGASDGELIGLARQVLADPQGHPEEFLAICRQVVDGTLAERGW